MIDYTKLIEKIVPEQDGPSPVHLRKATVIAVGSDTADITLSGVTVEDVDVLGGAQLEVGSLVQVLTGRGVMLILGKAGAPVTPPTINPSALAIFGNPSIANTSATMLTPTSVPVNDGGMWVSGTNFTIPAGQGGLYEMGIMARFASQVTASGQRHGRFFVNGSDFMYNAVDVAGLNGTLTPATCNARAVLAAGDTVAFAVFQSSGGALSLISGSHAWLERVR